MKAGRVSTAHFVRRAVTPWVGMVGLGLLCWPRAGFAHQDAEVGQLKLQVHRQGTLIQQLVEKVATLEARLEGRPLPPPAGPRPVSLESQEVPALSAEQSAAHVLARPWYQNIRMDGFGGAGFVWTGGDAVKEHGGFLNYEATLNVDAKIWEGIHYFHEIQTIRVGEEDTQFVRTGEVYVHFKDLLRTLLGREGHTVGMKLGRMDIPVGEDYLTQDVSENPLISFSAAYPYGFDEGIVLYGAVRGVHWIVGLMDGNDGRAVEDNADKFVSLKLYGNPIERLYLSASAFRNGESAESAWEFGGAHLVPVGSGGLTSSAGRSGSRSVDAYASEVDATYWLGPDRYLKAQTGFAFVDDDGSAFDRRIHYVQVEPKWNLGPRFANRLYLVGRFSAVGTFNEDKGYAFDGKPFAGGASAFGFDTKALYRWAVGLGYWLNPRTLLKVEYARDDFQTIRGSSLDDGAEQRDLVGALVATKF